jgi:hypothetical protein
MDRQVGEKKARQCPERAGAGHQEDCAALQQSLADLGFQPIWSQLATGGPMPRSDRRLSRKPIFRITLVVYIRLIDVAKAEQATSGAGA